MCDWGGGGGAIVKDVKCKSFFNRRRSIHKDNIFLSQFLHLICFPLWFNDPGEDFYHLDE